MIDFSNIQLPEHARVWIYQADRKLGAEEQSLILTKGKEFTASWAAHGAPLTAELFILENHFIILALDERSEAASGCSIDKSMRMVLELQQELKLNLTNRLISAAWENGEVTLYTYQEAKKALEDGQLTSKSLIFDQTIATISDLKHSWLKPLEETWLKKLLSHENVG